MQPGGRCGSPEGRDSSGQHLQAFREVFRDEKDGKVRQVSVAYKNFTEKVFRKSTRPIHKIVLVVHAEDANLPPLPAPAGPWWPHWPLLELPQLPWPCQLQLVPRWPHGPLLELPWPCQLQMALLWPLLALPWPPAAGPALAPAAGLCCGLSWPLYGLAGLRWHPQCINRGPHLARTPEAKKELLQLALP
jgi:hypothetical protein